MTAEATIDTLARTILGEARGEPWLGKVAVAWVIRNRADHPGWWGSDIVSVCRHSGQFDCWRESDPNYPIILAANLDQRDFQACYAAACAVVSGAVEDPAHGATHYYNPAVVTPPWASVFVETAVIEHHRFMRGN